VLELVRDDFALAFQKRDDVLLVAAALEDLGDLRDARVSFVMNYLELPRSG